MILPLKSGGECEILFSLNKIVIDLEISSNLFLRPRGEIEPRFLNFIPCDIFYLTSFMFLKMTLKTQDIDFKTC